MIVGKADCGLQYAIFRSGRAVGYCSLSIKCGTRDENGYPSGIAHFTEHTIFRGTTHKSASAINSYLEKGGGDINAYTTKEEIVLHATVLKEDITKAISMLIDLAACPTFPEDEIETEKGVVLDEIYSYKDSPADEVYDKFEELLFAGHPLERPILGTSKSVGKITSKDLKLFVSERFTPSKMALAIVADIDEKKLEQSALKIIDKFFGKELIINELPTIKYFLPKAEKFEKTLDKRNHEANAVIGSIAPSLYDGRKRISTILLSNILGGPASNSLLNSILREKKGWVYNVESSYTQYSDTGIFAISLGCERSNIEKCCKAIEKILLKLTENTLSETKLKAAKKQLIGQLSISADNGETTCLSMGKSLLAYEKIISDRIEKDLINSITAAELQTLSQDIFNPEHLSRLIYL